MTYTSPIKIAGLPLVSVMWENKGFREAKPSVGIIAVGQYAYGVISISQFGAGVFCISQFGVGAVGVFQFGVAGFSISQFAVNLFSGYGQFVFNLAKHLRL